MRRAQQQPRGGDTLLGQPALAQAGLDQRAHAAQCTHGEQGARLLLQQIIWQLQHLRARRQSDRAAVDGVHRGTPRADLARGAQRIEQVDELRHERRGNLGR